jgi:hypothetical protein
LFVLPYCYPEAITAWFASLRAPATAIKQRASGARPMTFSGGHCGRIPFRAQPALESAFSVPPLPPSLRDDSKTPMPAPAAAGPSPRIFRERVKAARVLCGLCGKSWRKNGQNQLPYLVPRSVREAL